MSLVGAPRFLRPGEVGDLEARFLALGVGSGILLWRHQKTALSCGKFAGCLLPSWRQATLIIHLSSERLAFEQGVTESPLGFTFR